VERQQALLVLFWQRRELMSASAWRCWAVTIWRAGRLVFYQLTVYQGSQLNY
jgi:hypothetical protein